MRKKQTGCLITAVLCIALLGGCAPRQGNAAPTPSVSAGALPQGVLLTVDGYEVTAEEFALFLQDQRALTAAYFSQTYGAEMDRGFWSREYGGQTPDDYAKSAALAQLLTGKMESILLCERGLLADISYRAFMADLEKNNAERAKKLENGEVIYGLTTYDPATYYSYVQSGRQTMLLESQMKLTQPTREELRTLYGENIALFTGETPYRCEIGHADGTTEIRTLTTEDFGKEDLAGYTLLETLADMEPGQQLTEVTLGEETVTVTLLEAEPAAVATLEEAQGMLTELYARAELQDLLVARVASATLVFDQTRYDAITLESAQ